MKALLKMAFYLFFIGFLGVVIIKVVYGCSWSEAFEIADSFISELLG